MKAFIEKYGDLFVITALAILVLAIFAQVTGFSFISFDDDRYIYENPAVAGGLSWASVKWAFTAFSSANWHPLTWLSHMMDVEMFGLRAGGHHAINVILHGVNSLLAFAVFRTMTGKVWQSAVVAALFAVHPAHVESVAWVAERKDVLSTLFWLVTMYAYFDWQRGGARIRSGGYILLVVTFALGLMAKPMLVTLPFVLLLCDFWPLERWKPFDWRELGKLVAEKLPLFVLSAASCVVTIFAQQSAGAIKTLDGMPFSMRVANAMVGYVRYIGELLYPANLAVVYPYEKQFSAIEIVGSAVLLAVITALCIRQIKTRKYLLAGWLWFIGTLIPVIGIVQVGSQSMADRYTYIPYFGLFIMLVWGAADLCARFRVDVRFAQGVCAAAVIVLAIVAREQTSYWRDSETLYGHTLAVTTNNFLISHNLCLALVVADRPNEAEPYCQQSLAINPDFPETHNTLGILELKRGDFTKSEQYFQEVVELSPRQAMGYANVAVAQAMAGKPDEAETNLGKAVSISGNTVSDASWISTLNDVAVAFLNKNDYEKAAVNFKRILLIDPNNLPARGNLAFALTHLGRYDEAQGLIESVIGVDKNDPKAFNIYGIVLLAKGQTADASKAFEAALKLKPDFVEAAGKSQKGIGLEVK